MRASNEMPTFDALFEPLIAALRALGGSGSIEEIYAKTVEVAGISEDVASQMHDPDKSNMTEMGYRLAWARTYLLKRNNKNQMQRKFCALKIFKRSYP